MERFSRAMILAACLLAGPAMGADTIEVKTLAPSARCRDSSMSVIDPPVRPMPPFLARKDRANGRVKAEIDGLPGCYFTIQEVGTGSGTPCSTAAVGQPSGTLVAGARDVEASTPTGCTR